MQGVASRHPPGLVAFCMGDLARYTTAMRSINATQAPAGSIDWWWQSNNIADTINRAFAATLENPDLGWCALMGDDHAYSPDLFLQLADRDVDVVVPLCTNRYPPFGPTIIANGGLKDWKELPGTGLYELQDGETCGDAGLFVRRHVLEAMDPPWYDRLRSGSLGVDDQCFVKKLKKVGYKVHIDMDNRIAHMTPFTLFPVHQDGRWKVRLGCGGRPVVDIEARDVPRTD